MAARFFFSFHIPPDRSRSPPSLLYDGYRVNFPR